MNTRHRRRARPHVEALEDRFLPTTPLIPSPYCLGVLRRPPRPVASPAQERLLFNLTNELRQHLGLTRLTQFSALSRAARHQAVALASLDRHPADENIHAVGGNVGNRARRAGYQWTGISENVYTTNDPQIGDALVGRALRNWLVSASHRINLLDPLYREVGLGVVRSASGVWHVVAIYGTRV
jgi:uncharacterized protein YkwD